LTQGESQSEHRPRATPSYLVAGAQEAHRVAPDDRCHGQPHGARLSVPKLDPVLERSPRL